MEGNNLNENTGHRSMIIPDIYPCRTVKDKTDGPKNHVINQVAIIGMRQPKACPALNINSYLFFSLVTLFMSYLEFHVLNLKLIHSLTPDRYSL